jgi:CO dehydrogenase/acetyl-CoA synthase beta subunit
LKIAVRKNDKRIDAADEEEEEEEEEEEDEEDEEDEDDLFSTATIWKNDLMLVFLTFFTA